MKCVTNFGILSASIIVLASCSDDATFHDAMSKRHAMDPVVASADAEVLSGERDPLDPNEDLLGSASDQEQIDEKKPDDALGDFKDEVHEKIHVVETFSQESRGILDVVVVIDDSGSMKPFQGRLKDRLAPLLSHIDKTNWRIAVTTTSPNLHNLDGTRPCHRDLIKYNDDPETISARFADAVEAGTKGSGNEQGVRQAVMGLSCELDGAPWVRANSTVAVLIVSDEDNCSRINPTSGVNDCGTLPWASPSYLTDFLINAKDHETLPGLGRQIGTDARVYGIIGVPGTDVKRCSSLGYPGVLYDELFKATGGHTGDICDEDYSGTLSAISQDMHSLLKANFELQGEPYSENIIVRINGVATTDFIVVSNTIQFTVAPPPFASIEVSYLTNAKKD